MMQSPLFERCGEHESVPEPINQPNSPNRASEDDGCDTPAMSTAGNDLVRSTSVSSSTTKSEASSMASKPVGVSEKAPLNKLSRPQIRTKTIESTRSPTPATRKRRIAFETRRRLMERGALNISKPPKSAGKEDTILTRLAKWQKKVRAQESNKPYKDLQKEGRNGVGALY